METFILLTFVPVPAGFVVPSEVLRVGEATGLTVKDGIERGERYIRISSRRDSDNLGKHVESVLEPLLDLVRLVRGGPQELPVQLGCVVYGGVQNGVCFSNSQVKTIADLGMSIDVQTYDIDDDE